MLAGAELEWEPLLASFDPRSGGDNVDAWLATADASEAGRQAGRQAGQLQGRVKARFVVHNDSNCTRMRVAAKSVADSHHSI